MSRPYELERFAARNRNRVYEVVVKALETAAVEKQINRKAIAEAIGRSPSQVSMTLSGPSNWTLDTVSDLLRGVGATMNYTVVFDDKQAKSNIYNAASAPPSGIAFAGTGSTLSHSGVATTSANTSTVLTTGETRFINAISASR